MSKTWPFDFDKEFSNDNPITISTTHRKAITMNVIKAEYKAWTNSFLSFLLLLSVGFFLCFGVGRLGELFACRFFFFFFFLFDFYLKVTFQAFCFDYWLKEKEWKRKKKSNK